MVNSLYIVMTSLLNKIFLHTSTIDQLTAEVIDTPSTESISDSLTAKVEVTLLDGSKVIVNVPVKVVEKIDSSQTTGD